MAEPPEETGRAREGVRGGKRRKGRVASRLLAHLERNLVSSHVVMVFNFLFYYLDLLVICMFLHGFGSCFVFFFIFIFLSNSDGVCLEGIWVGWWAFFLFLSCRVLLSIVG